MNKSEIYRRGFWGGLIMILVIFMFKHYINFNNEKDLIFGDYSIAIGRIIGYSEIGTHRSNYHEYLYIVDGIKYTRRFNSGVNMPECYEELSPECLKKRYWVIYSNQNPNLSLIDLSGEIQGIENPAFPKTLENFK